MNIKLSVVLVIFLIITLQNEQYFGKSFSVLASDIEMNVTQSEIQKISTIMTMANKSKECSPLYVYDQLKSTSILYGIIKIVSQRLNTESNKCYQELNQIYDGIHRKEIWAIKVLDSSAMPLPGFILGHNFWMGSMQGCEAVQKPPPLTISNRFVRIMHTDLWSATAPFNIGYRMVYAEHRSPWQVQVEFMREKNKILHVGLCLPNSCSNDEIANLTQEFFDSTTLNAQIMHDYQPNVLEVKDLKVKTNLMDKLSFRAFGICVMFSLYIMVIAYIREDSENDETAKNKNIIETRTEPNEIVSSVFVKDSHSNPPDAVIQCPKTNLPKKMLFDEIVKFFSIRRNMKFLITVDKPPNAVPIIDGLKTIGCFLLFIFHVYWYNNFTVHNSTMSYSYGEQAVWHIIGSPIIVDLFFTISGFLLGYNFLCNQSRMNEIKNNTIIQNVKLFGKQLLNRYIRLTPMYLFVIGCVEFITSRMVEISPFWIHDRNDIKCSKYWWRNILYIHNLFSMDDMCVNWSWSMACEMQFFILSSILLFIYAKYPNVGKAIFCSLFGIFLGLAFSIAIFTKFTPAYDVSNSLFTDVYIAPWTRIVPYLIGIAAGYSMHTFKGKLPLDEKTIKLIWTSITIVVILTHISTIYRNVSYYTAAISLTFIRVLYPASISWMILASHAGHGGIFAKILNDKIFVHIGKLTYGLYLIHPIIISVLYGWQDHSTHSDLVSVMVMTTGIMIIAYLLSIVCSIIIDIPFTNMLLKIMSHLLSSKKIILTSSPKTSESIETKKIP